MLKCSQVQLLRDLFKHIPCLMLQVSFYRKWMYDHSHFVSLCAWYSHFVTVGCHLPSFIFAVLCLWIFHHWSTCDAASSSVSAFSFQESNHKSIFTKSRQGSSPAKTIKDLLVKRGSEASKSPYPVGSGSGILKYTKSMTDKIGRKCGSQDPEVYDSEPLDIKPFPLDRPREDFTVRTKVTRCYD